MFGGNDIFGWRSPIGQTLLAAAAAAAILAVHHVMGQNFALMAAAAPIGAYLMLKRTYLIAIVFIGFSFFRLHEAFPTLAPPGVVGLTGAALVAGLLWRGFRLEAANRVSELRVLSLAFAMAAVAFGLALEVTKASYATPNGLLLGTLMIVCICVAMACWRQFLARGTAEGWPSPMNYFTLFFIYISICVPFAFDPSVSFSHFNNVWWKIGVVFYAISWFSRTEDDFGLTLRAILIFGLLIASVAIYNKINEIDLVEGTRVTISGMISAPGTSVSEVDPDASYGSMLGDPNDLALVLLFPLGFGCALLQYRSGRVLTALAFSVVIACMLAIVYTESRGGLLGVLTVGGVIGLKMIRSRALLIACGVVAAIGLYVAAGIGDRSTAVAADGGLDHSSMGRIYAWIAATKMLVGNPLTGVGMAGFVQAHAGGYEYYLTGYNWAVHSTWFGVLAEGGIPGIALFVAMFVTALRTARSCLRRFEELGADMRLRACALGLMAGLAGFGVSGAFLTHGFLWPIYIQVALVVALWRCLRRIEMAREDDDRDASRVRPWWPRTHSETKWTPPSDPLEAGRANGKMAQR